MKIGLWAVCIILNNFDIFLLNLSLTVNISIKVLPNELVSSMLIVFFNLCLSRITEKKFEFLWSVAFHGWISFRAKKKL